MTSVRKKTAAPPTEPGHSDSAALLLAHVKVLDAMKEIGSLFWQLNNVYSTLQNAHRYLEKMEQSRPDIT